VQQAAALLRLFEAPHYFRRAGKGRFRKASAEILQQALVGHREEEAAAGQISAWAAELASGGCPPEIREQLYKILFKPDKNAPEYKAVVEASRNTQTAPLALLQRAGAITSPYQFHWSASCWIGSPRARASRRCARRRSRTTAARRVQAFSIDDSSTTEIDDALSVQGLGSGTVTVGVHIAAPGLALQPAAPLDQLARQRLSTVYMPGYKITMLPDDVVQAYTLLEGRDCPAVSLYVRFDEATLELQGSETRLERVPIAPTCGTTSSMHLDRAWLEEPAAAATCPSRARFRAELSFLFRLAKQLKAQREVLRGKPENFTRPDYNFRVPTAGEQGPTGEEPVEITVRKRGAPLDLIVAEAMILANSTWGQWLAENGVPGIYRSQASLAPASRCAWAPRRCRTPHRGEELRLEHLAAAPLHGPGEPVADHRGGPPRAHGGPGGALQAQGRGAVLDHLRLRRRLRRLQRAPGRHGALLDAQVPAAERGARTGGHRLQGQPRPRRHPAAGAAAARRGGPAAGRPGCACAWARST
jgi:exoribonuclease-2